MKKAWKMALASACLFLLATAAYAQKLPDGKGKAELISGCTACHGTAMIVQKRRTPQDWKKVVNDMAARGSDSTPQDINNIIRYLSTNFGIKQTGTTAAPQSATPPSSTPSKH